MFPMYKHYEIQSQIKRSQRNFRNQNLTYFNFEKYN
jgi:hypothetical protein